MDERQTEKRRLLDEWSGLIVNSARSGALTKDAAKPIPIDRVRAVNGPRAGALELRAGLESDRLLRILRHADHALLRQFVPWRFVGEPACFMAGPFVRVEAGWPVSLAETDIKLADLGQHPKDGGRWVAGRDEHGRTVTLGLDSAKPHYLFGGTTGSGKSVAMQVAVSQLCRDPDNRIVLIDGKFGEGLGSLAAVPNRVGPLAADTESARRALSYAIGMMRERYEHPNGQGRLVIVMDEVQELCRDNNITQMIWRLVSLGRAAKVYCVLGTQNPTAAMFGDNSSIKRLLPGRLALKVTDADASRVVVGGAKPRADHLLGTGDAYAIASGVICRMQLAYIPERDLENLPRGQAMLESWPEYDAEAGGTLPEDTVNWAYTGKELGMAVLAARLEFGRRKMVGFMRDRGSVICEGDRAKRLSQLGKEALDFLMSNDFCGEGERVGGLATDNTHPRGFEAFLGDD